MDVLIPYSPDETLPLVHVEDIAGMLATVAAAERCSHNIYNSFGDCVHPSELKKEIESLNPNARVMLGDASVTGCARAIDSSRFAKEFGGFAQWILAKTATTSARSPHHSLKMFP